MARKKHAIKTAKAKKTSEKIEKIDIPKEGTIKDDQSTLPKKDLFRIDEVANYFSVTDRTIRLWIDHGHLKTEKLHGSVRILRESILNFRLKSRVRFT